MSFSVIVTQGHYLTCLIDYSLTIMLEYRQSDNEPDLYMPNVVEATGHVWKRQPADTFGKVPVCFQQLTTDKIILGCCQGLPASILIRHNVCNLIPSDGTCREDRCSHPIFLGSQYAPAESINPPLATDSTLTPSSHQPTVSYPQSFSFAHFLTSNSIFSLTLSPHHQYHHHSIKIQINVRKCPHPQQPPRPQPPTNPTSPSPPPLPAPPPPTQPSAAN